VVDFGAHSLSPADASQQWGHLILPQCLYMIRIHFCTYVPGEDVLKAQNERCPQSNQMPSLPQKVS
jgi:hypothetical protein